MAKKIVSTKDICGGSPRIDGTRLTCANIVSTLYFGDMSLDNFFSVYDYLTFDDIIQCLKYCMCQTCLKNNVLAFCQHCKLFKETDDDEIINEQKEMWNYAELLLNKFFSDNSPNSKVVGLRKITGHGMMFCYRALKEVEWDFVKAVKYLEDNPPVYLTSKDSGENTVLTKEEIFRYINVGSGSISVDRRLLEKYPGIIRDIVITGDASVRIEFHNKHTITSDEGEVSFCFQYENYDILFDELEKFLGLKMDEWQNNNKTGWYPEPHDEYLKKSWDMLATDFINSNLPFPSNFKSFRPNMYWEALYNGELKIDSSPEEISDWLRKKAADYDSDDD
ncbi:DUF433 domain-containing protein [Acetivibrio cellulolyticus]|uniref:DUF433 domain-containing protein n=1 Tax=Acetivibrio cellulolyticus TaxID=35830 RepID=UPI0001E2D55B|nr:DUF433 domain-containing protein [Acetivibrio cellulolyticus]